MKKMILWAAMALAAMSNMQASTIVYEDAVISKEYKLTGRFHNLEPDNDETDKYWLERGYASIVPVRPDMSAVDAICAISERILNNRQ